MKSTMLFASLALVLASSASMGKTELEALRDLCAEQERQIQQLELENSRLRDTPPPSRTLPSGIQMISTPTSRPAAVPAAATAAPLVYTVRPGDSLGRISSKTGVSTATLAKLNGLKTSSLLHPNQKLKLPDSPATSGPRAQASATPSSRPTGASYKVQAGDTFFSIARKHNLSTDALIAANPNTKPSALRPGQLVNLTIAEPAPRPATAAVAQNLPVSATAPTVQAFQDTPPAPAPEKKIRPIMIEGEMTFGDFAAKHGTDAERLNALNGLDLTTATVLAKGSELYVPAQP